MSGLWPPKKGIDDNTLSFHADRKPYQIFRINGIWRIGSFGKTDENGHREILDYVKLDECKNKKWNFNIRILDLTNYSINN